MIDATKIDKSIVKSECNNEEDVLAECDSDNGDDSATRLYAILEKAKLIKSYGKMYRSCSPVFRIQLAKKRDRPQKSMVNYIMSFLELQRSGIP